MDGLVIIVEDDPSLREATARLLRAEGLEVQDYGSCEEFLEAPPPVPPCCLLLDVQLPGQDGLSLQESLRRAGADLPIVFLTGQSDVKTVVRAMKGGAQEYLAKPFDAAQLRAAVVAALGRSQAHAKGSAVLGELRRRFQTLTAREREVLALVAAGLPNKEVGSELGIAEKTVKIHRARVMRKLRATSVADLVRCADALGVAAPQPRAGPSDRS